MIVHSGAALHRHEFSTPLDYRRNSIPRRSHLTRSTFSNPITRRASTSERPTPILEQRARPVSEYTPRPTEPAVRFQEPELDSMSEDGMSVVHSLVNSVDSEITAGGGRRPRRLPRTSTAFRLAQPAPTLTQKQRLLEIRPRLLLQLQKLAADSRPRPTLDVLPSTVVVPRLSKKFPRMFRGKGELGANDVMVVKSEEYDTPGNHAAEETDSDEESVANRDLIAVICQLGKDCGGSNGMAEIVLSDGSVWVGTPLPNGLYEFITTDERGDKTTARWVKRNTPRSNAHTPGSNEFKFTFSIIDPHSRRHPIMASITQNILDIPDYYTSVSSSAGKYHSTSPPRNISSEAELQAAVDEPVPDRTTHAIDENMKTLIQVTGIWVALRQGLSAHFLYNDATTTPSGSISPRNVSGGRFRSLSLTTDAGRVSPAGTGSSTPESSHSNFGAVVGRKIRRPCANRSPPGTASPQYERPGLPARSVSNGTAFMQRAAARRAGHPPSTVASDSEGEGVPHPPKRAATDTLTASHSNYMSTPQSRTLPGSSRTTPDTPTKPSRRVQSAFIPSSSLQNGCTNGRIDRHSMEIIVGKQSSDYVEKPKISRWKAFRAALLRHSRRSTRVG